MPNDGTGNLWDETGPVNTDPLRDGAREIRDIRKGLRIRLEKEHETLATDEAGGEHLKGSAKSFYQTDDPTKRPDTTTDLDSDDAGRLLVRSDTKKPRVFDGTLFQDVVVDEDNIATDAVKTAKIEDAAVTTGKIADLGVTDAKISSSGRTEGDLLEADASGAARWVTKPTVDVQTFDANDMWTKPSRGELVFVECWGGGGGSGHNSTSPRGGGGGGGGYTSKLFSFAALDATVAVTIGVGGAGGISSSKDGNAGGTTQFGALLSAFGGGGGGEGGGGSTNIGGGEGGHATTGETDFSIGRGQNGSFSGGNGCGGGDSGDLKGGHSTYGGGGGGRGTGMGGISQFGGNGGGSAVGVAPGGGGGTTVPQTGDGFAGGKGRVKVTTF